MPILLFKGFPHLKVYNGPGVYVEAGKECEVSNEKAAYLLDTFGNAFEAVGSAVAKPKKSRAVKSPAKKRPAAKGEK